MKQGFGLQWHITDSCDQRCKHCYIYAGGSKKTVEKELPLEVLKLILEDFISMCIKLNRIPSIAITGGDPLLYNKAWEFFELLFSKNIKFSILGNPFHLNNSVACRLKSLGCTNYQMSLDGMRGTHDYIRKPGSFDETLSKIRCLNDSGIQSTIMTTVSKLNIDEIPEVAKTAIEHDVTNFAFARFCPNDNDTKYNVLPSEYRALLDKMWRFYSDNIDSNTRFVLKDHLWKLYLMEKGLFTIDSKEDIIIDGCHCGISHLTILSDGSVYACRRFESIVGKVPDQSLYDIYFSDDMEKYRDYCAFEACSKCELLRYCRGCPAVAYCTNGNFYSKDPQCWKQNF